MKNCKLFTLFGHNDASSAIQQISPKYLHLCKSLYFTALRQLLFLRRACSQKSDPLQHLCFYKSINGAKMISKYRFQEEPNQFYCGLFKINMSFTISLQTSNRNPTSSQTSAATASTAAHIRCFGIRYFETFTANVCFNIALYTGLSSS